MLKNNILNIKICFWLSIFVYLGRGHNFTFLTSYGLAAFTCIQTDRRHVGIYRVFMIATLNIELTKNV